MKKVAVLNCSHIYNYGSVLQSYAMEQVIRDITSLDVYSIRYRQKKNFTYVKDYMPVLVNKGAVSLKLKGIKRKLYLKFFNKNLKNQCSIRETYFAKFVKQYFHFSPIYEGKSQLKAAVNDYCCVILGSDQVWHPINYGSHYYTMEWVPDSIPKITYAASFGVSEIPNNQIKGTKAYLKRIDTISVREKKGAEIVSKLTGKTVPVVIDPTLLLELSQWERLCNQIEEKDYIFCYFLGDNENARQFALGVKKKTGLPILCIPFMDEINKVDLIFGDEQLFKVGPAEFLSYIKNAKYIITDSFHGTVFSLIFHKQFITFNRFSSSNGGSTNSRIDTLLDQVGLSNRRFSKNASIDEKIEYDKVDDILDQLREKSYYFLKEGLKRSGVIK